MRPQRAFQVAGTTRATIWRQERAGWLAVAHPGCLGGCGKESLSERLAEGALGGVFKGGLLQVESGMGL